jgi:hypothetical protein
MIANLIIRKLGKFVTNKFSEVTMPSKILIVSVLFMVVFGIIFIFYKIYQVTNNIKFDNKKETIGVLVSFDSGRGSQGKLMFLVDNKKYYGYIITNTKSTLGEKFIVEYEAVNPSKCNIIKSKPLFTEGECNSC